MISWSVGVLCVGVGVVCGVLVEDSYSFALFCPQQHFRGWYHDHIIHYMKRRVAQSCYMCRWCPLQKFICFDEKNTICHKRNIQNSASAIFHAPRSLFVASRLLRNSSQPFLGYMLHQRSNSSCELVPGCDKSRENPDNFVIVHDMLRFIFDSMKQNNNMDLVCEPSSHSNHLLTPRPALSQHLKAVHPYSKKVET